MRRTRETHSKARSRGASWALVKVLDKDAEAFNGQAGDGRDRTARPPGCLVICHIKIPLGTFAAGLCS